MVVIYVIEVIITTLSLFCHGKTTRITSRGAVGWKNEGSTVLAGELFPSVVSRHN